MSAAHDRIATLEAQIERYKSSIAITDRNFRGMQEDRDHWRGVAQGTDDDLAEALAAAATAERDRDAFEEACNVLRRDRDEWRTQHENLLAMYRVSESGRTTLRTALQAARERHGECCLSWDGGVCDCGHDSAIDAAARRATTAEVCEQEPLRSAARSLLDYVRFRPSEFGGSYDAKPLGAHLTALHEALAARGATTVVTKENP